jgi:hypothetical protein
LVSAWKFLGAGMVIILLKTGKAASPYAFTEKAGSVGILGLKEEAMVWMMFFIGSEKAIDGICRFGEINRNCGWSKYYYYTGTDYSDRGIEPERTLRVS